MEKTLKEKVDDALVEMLDGWENAKAIGSIATLSLLIECTLTYQALLKDYEQEQEGMELS